jgi:hypothetical protein
MILGFQTFWSKILNWCFPKVQRESLRNFHILVESNSFLGGDEMAIKPYTGTSRCSFLSQEDTSLFRTPTFIPNWPCSGQRDNYVPPYSDTRHLFDTWEKNRGPEFDTFSPGTEYHFAHSFLRFEGRAHHFFTLIWKKGQVFDTTVTEIGKNRWNIETSTSYLPLPSCRGLQCMIYEAIRAFCGALRTFCIQRVDNR